MVLCVGTGCWLILVAVVDLVDTCRWWSRYTLTKATVVHTVFFCPALKVTRARRFSIKSAVNFIDTSFWCDRSGHRISYHELLNCTFSAVVTAVFGSPCSILWIIAHILSISLTVLKFIYTSGGWRSWTIAESTEVSTVILGPFVIRRLT